MLLKSVLSIQPLCNEQIQIEASKHTEGEIQRDLWDGERRIEQIEGEAMQNLES